MKRGKAYSGFDQVYHPINNPVDFRYAKDNKYMVG